MLMKKPKRLCYIVMEQTVAKNIFKPRACFTDKQVATDCLVGQEYLESVYLNTDETSPRKMA